MTQHNSQFNGRESIKKRVATARRPQLSWYQWRGQNSNLRPRGYKFAPIHAEYPWILRAFFILYAKPSRCKASHPISKTLVNFSSFEVYQRHQTSIARVVEHQTVGATNGDVSSHMATIFVRNSLPVGINYWRSWGGVLRPTTPPTSNPHPLLLVESSGK
jgi:hypothetical protein